MSEFNRNLEDLLYLSSNKDKLVNHLKKNYKENIHYILEKSPYNNKKHGGHNKINYLLTETAFELIKNTYNLRNKYLVNETDCVKQINVIAMCIENQTVGFIENAYNSVFNIKRQYYIGKYRVDLYFINYKIVIECDENNHIDRNRMDEQIRENYLISLGNKIIHFNPNEINFDLSNVIKKINEILFL
jgi:very-short-patch-repair endonuclease